MKDNDLNFLRKCINYIKSRTDSNIIINKCKDMIKVLDKYKGDKK